MRCGGRGLQRFRSPGADHDRARASREERRRPEPAEASEPGHAAAYRLHQTDPARHAPRGAVACNSDGSARHVYEASRLVTAGRSVPYALFARPHVFLPAAVPAIKGGGGNDSVTHVSASLRSNALWRLSTWGKP